MKVVHDIRLEFVYPPIPDRSWDWSATRSNYDPDPSARDLIGRGATPILALTDLLEQELERESD